MTYISNLIRSLGLDFYDAPDDLRDASLAETHALPRKTKWITPLPWKVGFTPFRPKIIAPFELVISQLPSGRDVDFDS